MSGVSVVDDCEDREERERWAANVSGMYGVLRAHVFKWDTVVVVLLLLLDVLV